MDINDILTAPTGIKRPSHPDFWKLSEIILALMGDKQDLERGRIDMAEFERRWRAHYDEVGDFDSIAYCAMQAAFALHGIETGADWQRLMANPARHMAYVQTVQAYFDGFIMGAKLERSRTEGNIASFSRADAEKVAGRPISDGEYRALTKTAAISFPEVFTEMVHTVLEEE